jgi:hypothetical protein
VTQTADRRAHLVTTPRRCAFGLFVAYAYATALPAKTRLLTLRTSDNISGLHDDQLDAVSQQPLPQVQDVRRPGGDLLHP